MLWGCRSCGTRLAVGLLRCPHCSSGDITQNVEEVEALPKISKEEGASIADAWEPAHPEGAHALTGDPHAEGGDSDTFGDTGATEVAPSDEGDTDRNKYADWEYSDLQAAAKDRGLDARGKRDELVDRLTEDDKTGPADHSAV